MQPTCTTAATSSSPPGVYSSSCSGAVDANYKISYVNGTVNISGGASQTITLSSYLLDFGNQPVGTTSPPELLKLINKTALPVTLRAVTTRGDFAVPATPRTTCSTSIASGTSCYMYVVFKPTATGLRTGVLAISDSAPGSSQTVKLEGHGVGVLVSPTYLAWPLN